MVNLAGHVQPVVGVDFSSAPSARKPIVLARGRADIDVISAAKTPATK
jgi:hypothetical protein